MNPWQRITTWTGVIAIVGITILALWLSTDSNQPVIIPIKADTGFAVVAVGEMYDDVTKGSKEILFEIPTADCEKQPEWDPSTQELPIPMEKLKKVALENGVGPDESTWAMWKITNVAFSRLGYTETQERRVRENRWSCLMTLTNQDPAHYSYITVCVLLDGTFVQPKKLVGGMPVAAPVPPPGPLPEPPPSDPAGGPPPNTPPGG